MEPNRIKEKYIFLDVDGPINTNRNIRIQHALGKSTCSYYIELPRKKILNIKEIVNNTGAKIVVSSSWRLGFEGIKPSSAYLNLERQLNKYHVFLEGWTPYHDDGRGVEISLWLNDFEQINGYIPDYIIIDDDDFDIQQHKGRIIKTSAEFGLCEEHIRKAIYLLNYINRR